MASNEQNNKPTIKQDLFCAMILLIIALILFAIEYAIFQTYFKNFCIPMFEVDGQNPCLPNYRDQPYRPNLKFPTPPPDG